MKNLVGFIPRKRMERAAAALLGEYAAYSGWDYKPPIPIEELIRFVGYEIEYDYLSEAAGIPGILGVIDMQAGRIWIDDVLTHHMRHGVLRFTLAHELSHYICHGPGGLKYMPTQPRIAGPAAYMCNPEQVAQQKPTYEVQADMQAAEILIPTELVETSFNQLVAHYSDASAMEHEREIVTELKIQFECSYQAMRNRLRNLKLWTLVNNPVETAVAF